jgi:hypothetical protein
MKIVRLVFWYASNLESLDVVYLMFTGVPLFFYGIVSFVSHGLLGLVAPIGLSLLTILLYFSAIRSCRTYLVATVRSRMTRIDDRVLLGKTSEKGTDSIDVEVLKKLQAVGGDPFALPRQISGSALRQDELIPRLARLCVLGYINLNKSKLVLTPEGQDILNMPGYMLQTHIPPEVSKRLVEIRADLNSGAFADTIDKTNKLFEYLLSEKLRSSFDMAETWQSLVHAGVVKHAFEKCSVGELAAACKALRVFKEGDMYDKFLGIFLTLRVPQKRETDVASDSMHAAETSLDLVRAFTRHWFD